jgi:two-component system, chemotaxis family, CheB/CheR fusion protein
MGHIDEQQAVPDSRIMGVQRACRDGVDGFATTTPPRKRVALTVESTSPVNQPDLRPSSLPFAVVGIGASAGGITAIKRFLKHMPSDSGMAFVVVLHLSPKHGSTADAVLQSSTRMPVVQVLESTAIEPNHVYVISPNRHLVMDDGMLLLTELERPHGHHVAVDLFFRALADVHRTRAIAIVLSGTGSDGSVGLTRIKEQGGLTLAQSPDDCEYDDMPSHAIATGMVDFVLPAVEMPQKLLDLAANAGSITLPPNEAFDDVPGRLQAADEARQAERALHDVLGLLRERTGHDFRHYKRATVLRRLERRMQVNGVSDLAAYHRYLQSKTDETIGLLKDMLIGVTNFFRDREAFEALERDTVPVLFEGKGPGDQVRAWVAACATGEEAYSVAILLADHASRMSDPPSIQVFATDIDEAAIATARSASYPEAIITDVAPSYLRDYFTKEPQRYVVSKPVRDTVLFAMHNLLRDPPFSRLDLICCRNLLIYLDRSVQERVLEMFHFALRPGGHLFLGSSESAEAVSRYFVAVDKKNRIFQSVASTRTPRYSPALALGGFERSAALPPPARPGERRGFSFADIHQRAVEMYAPPSVVVKADGTIVHASERSGDFLRYRAGEPSHNLVSLVLPELRLELRTTLFQAAQSGKSVEARRVKVMRDGRERFVNMTARPFRDESATADFVLVLFDEIEDSMGSDGIAGAAGDDTVAARLEEELQRTREYLQSTIEQSETSTEELKASNEELQALNEELRSASEELETSKEELQSINEELTTVNQELKCKVDEISKANDDLQNLIASTDLATIFVDGRLHIKRFTPRATDLFNIIPTDIGRSLLDITHRLDYTDLAKDAQRVFDTLSQVEREVRSVDGRYFVARLLPYRTAEHRIDGALLTFFDISGRRRAEEDLRIGEERMRLVVQSTHDYAIVTTDACGLTTSWNTGAERMFGYGAQEMLGQSLDRIFTQEDRERGEPGNERLRALEHGRSVDERWHLRKDGSRFFCSGVLTPLDDGELRGFARIARDLTDVKRIESEREASLLRERRIRAEVQAGAALKDEFLAVMSHELKHPLNLINVNADLLTRLKGVREVPAAAKAAETIQRAVVGQARIIDDLLDLSRLHTGKFALALTDVDLVELVREAVEVVQADRSSSDLSIDVVLPDTVVPVLADPVRVEQMVWNLLGNAIKFTPPGGAVRVELHCEDAAARIDVIDNGQGIDPELLPRIYDMFGQAGTALQRNRGGMGIGLALVRQLVELHHGRIEVASEGVGLGTRCSIWLPLSAPCAGDGETSSASPALEDLRILVVDDARETVNSFQLLLELEGATVYPAFSGAEALAIAQAQPVDVLLSDIGMPEMDGHQLIRALRSLPQYATLPAIALSGYGRPDDVRAAIASGFTTHMTKPVTIDRLLQAITRLRPAKS